MKLSDHKGVMAQFIWNEEDVPYLTKVRNAQDWLNPMQKPHPMQKPASPERFLNLHREVPKLSFPANIETSLPQYLTFRADFAFDGDLNTFFWSSRPPGAGEVFTLKLTEPKETSKVIIKTGVQQMNGQDRVFNGLLRVSSDSDCSVAAQSKIDASGTAMVKLPSSMQTVRCVQMEVLEAQENWVVISEIQFV
mmetsp:Transcript_14966/g.20977  ORF Transcript_14966/g.20977 Transcript_14966/m.20977 type:complete len:193 (+) Transcript_14966:40-618(+)